MGIDFYPPATGIRGIHANDNGNILKNEGEDEGKPGLLFVMFDRDRLPTEVKFLVCWGSWTPPHKSYFSFIQEYLSNPQTKYGVLC